MPQSLAKKKNKNDPVKIVGGFHVLEQQIWDLSNKHGLLMGAVFSDGEGINCW